MEIANMNSNTLSSDSWCGAAAFLGMFGGAGAASLMAFPSGAVALCALGGSIAASLYTNMIYEGNAFMPNVVGTGSTVLGCLIGSGVGLAIGGGFGFAAGGFIGGTVSRYIARQIVNQR